MTNEEARKEAEQILKGAEVPDAALDAWYLLEYAIRKIEKKETGRTWYLMNRKESILPGTLLYYQICSPVKHSLYRCDRYFCHGSVRLPCCKLLQHHTRF